MIVLHLPIEPMGCPRPRATIRGAHASVYMPADYRKWQQAAATAIHGAILAAGYVEFSRLMVSGFGARISVEAVFPRTQAAPASVGRPLWKTGCRVRFRRFDADNVLKACMDALQVAIRERIGAETWDDKSLEIGRVDRWYAAAGESAHIRMTLEPLEDA